MNNKKHIDQLFQDKFKNFEANPAPEVWEAIEAQLEEKKKKRILPFWWKLSGVAALLLLGIFIANSLYNPFIPFKNPVVLKDSPFNTSSNTSSKKANDTSPKNSYPFSKNSVSFESTTKTSDDAVRHKTTAPVQIIVEHNPAPKNKGIVNNSQRISYLHNSQKQIASTIHSRKTFNANATREDTLVAPQPATDDNNNSPHNIAIKEANKALESDKSLVDLDRLKGAQQTKIASVLEETKVNDTCQNTSVAANALEELLNEKESKPKQQPKENSWQIASTVAPVFLGSVSNGSPVDPMFENNTKTYNTSFSMGIGLTYAVNRKFSVRTGINKMALSYNTNGITFFADLQDTSMANINPSSSGKGIKVENIAVATGSLLPFENAFVHKNEGYLNQKIGYYEVPFEISYALLNKRFGLKVIGGLSTFFLNENSISVVSGNLSTNLGKANNLSNTHFSSNIGLGLNYGFMKSFVFNVEPTIKYQLNTFSSNAGNFKPYIIGIYSGISYKF